MKLDRRTFLAAAGSAPVVYGLREIFGTSGDADWFGTALRRMKETRRYGIVLIVPREGRERQEVGTRLLSLLESPDGGAHALFCEAVFICLTPELAAGRVRSAFEKQNRILLDPHGRRVEADTIDLPVFQPRTFAASFEAFLHGRDGARLAGHARAIERTLPDDVRRALARLDDASVDVRSEASSVVYRHAEAMIPTLVHLGKSGRNEEYRSRCRGIIQEVFRGSDAGRFGPRLPYGTVRAEIRVDSCPACGRVRASHRSRKLLRFLAK